MCRYERRGASTGSAGRVQAEKQERSNHMDACCYGKHSIYCSVCVEHLQQHMSTFHSGHVLPVLCVFELALSFGDIVSKLLVAMVCLVNTSVEEGYVITLVVRPQQRAQAVSS